MAQPSLPQRRHPRLHDFDYSSPHVVSVTICVRDRRPVFSDADLAKSAVDTLLEATARTAMRLHAYCVMPDHVHILVQPSGKGATVPDLVRRFKGPMTATFRRAGISGKVWQASFWDHVVRTDENLQASVEYILANPIRARLVEDAMEYPWSGAPGAVPLSERPDCGGG